MSTTPNSIITPQALVPGSPTNGLTNANGTAAVTVFTADTDGDILSALNVFSTDTATGLMTLNLVISAVTYPLVTTQIPIGAGSLTSAPPVNLLSATIFPSLPKDANGSPVLNVPPGGSLTVSMAVAPTTAKVFTVVPINAKKM